MRFANENGFYELNPFPGCNQLVVSNHSLVYPEKRGVGVGTQEHHKRLQQIKFLGYDYVICTVKADNIPQIKILEKMGWKQLDSFLNGETNNTVFIYGRKMCEQIPSL